MGRDALSTEQFVFRTRQRVPLTGSESKFTFSRGSGRRPALRKGGESASTTINENSRLHMRFVGVVRTLEGNNKEWQPTRPRRRRVI